MLEVWSEVVPPFNLMPRSALEVCVCVHVCYSVFV